MALEKLTQKELETLRELSAKQKRIARAEKQFLSEADSRKEELLKRWGINDDLSFIADLYYGVSKEELRSFITSDNQVNYFKRTRGNE